MGNAVIRDDLTSSSAQGSQRRPLGFRGFVALMAALMALNAFAIDTMIPALPAMARDFGLANVTQAQLVIGAYVMGLAGGQLFYGVLSDRFGRRPVLLAGIGIYVVFSLAAALSTSMEMMILARVAQGAGASATRVLTISIVRDRFSGRQMARVMSLVFIVFMLTPILAPAIGQGIVQVSSWPWLFATLALIGAVIFALVWWRLPESLHPEDRLPLSASRIYEAFREVVSNRLSLGYTAAGTLVISAMFGFVNTAQQIFSEVYPLGTLFPLAFASLGLAMAVAGLVNSRVVERLGSRRVSHAALLGVVALSAAHALLALFGRDTLVTFLPLQAATMFCVGLIGPNFNAMAMNPMGHIAGTASSVQGFISTMGAAVFGAIIGQCFNGTSLPMVLGFLIMGAGALIVVVFTERGRLFTPQQPAKPPS